MTLDIHCILWYFVQCYQMYSQCMRCCWSVFCVYTSSDHLRFEFFFRLFVVYLKCCYYIYMHGILFDMYTPCPNWSDAKFPITFILARFIVFDCHFHHSYSMMPRPLEPVDRAAFFGLMHTHHRHRVARPWQDIAVSTSFCHLEWSCARFHAELRPRLCCWRSSSIVRSQVRPNSQRAIQAKIWLAAYHLSAGTGIEASIYYVLQCGAATSPIINISTQQFVH